MRNKKRGFRYRVAKEKLIEYIRLSAGDKLRWLEEINEFTRMAQTTEAQRIREQLTDKSWKRSGYDNF